MSFRVIKKEILIIPILIIFICCFLSFKENLEKTYNLENNEISDSDNNIALMIEQTDGTYIESSANAWPINMKFNAELSGCIDINGNKIDNVLEYNGKNNKVSVNVTGTTYCHVYFDIKELCKNGEILSECIARNSDAGVEEIWNSSLKGDGYRYVGTNPNNYICFGTSNKDTCLNDTDKYMYRIIGIFEDSSGNKHAKLIKKERIGNGYTWYKDDYADIDWNESDLYKGLNGSYFLTNTSYPYMQDSTWNNKIATWNYTMTNTKTMEYYDYNSYYRRDYIIYTGKEIYLYELNVNGKANGFEGEWKSLNAKISLMYVSDYALSLGEQSLNYTGEDNSDKLVTGWIHLWNNDGYEVDDIEWTMSRAGCEDGDYCRAWGITKDGDIMYTAIGLDSSSDVRPVFYLTSDVTFLNGIGSIDNPLLIK